MRRYLLASLFLALFPGAVAHAQFFQLSTTGPHQVSPCQEADIVVTINNISPLPQPAGDLTYCLPQGAAYAGVAGNPSVTVLDSTDARCPVLRLPPFAPNGSIVFTLRARFSCSAEPGGVTDTIQLNVDGKTEFFKGHQYNIQLPVVLLSPGANWNYTGSPGDVFTRTFTLRNTGFGDAVRVFFIDNTAGAGLQLLSTTGTQSGDTIVLTGSDLGTDGLLKKDETITVTQELKILGCSNGTQAVVFGWACTDGTLCDMDAEAYQVIVVVTDEPNLDLQLAQPVPIPKPCEPSEVRIRIRNSGTVLAINVRVQTGFSTNPSNPDALLYKTGCFPLTDFKVGNAPVGDSSFFSASPYLLLFSSLTADPDGPGGLSDEDGDGLYDDLAPGAELLLSFQMGFDPACHSCNSDMYDPDLGVRATYAGACSEIKRAILPTTIFTSVDVSFWHFRDVNATAFEEGQAYDFNYDVDITVYALPSVCPDKTITVRFQLPGVLQPQPGFQPLFNGSPVPFDVQANVITVQIPSLYGRLTLPLEVLCPPDPIDGPCNQPILPGRYQVRANLFWDCGNGCAGTLHLACFNGTPFTVGCLPAPPSSDTVRAVVATGFTAKRTTLGYLDNARTQQVSAATPGLNLTVGMPYDTVLLRARGEVMGGVNDVFDTTTLRLFYWNGSSQPYFTFVSATLQYYDAEKDTTVECVLAIPANTYQLGYHIRRFALLPLTQPGGCLYAAGIHITPGDHLTIECTAALTESLPHGGIILVETFLAAFEYQYQGSSVVCGTEGALFQTLRPNWDYEFYGDLSEEICKNGYLEVRMEQGQTTVSGDPFPGEIRPVYVFDTVTVAIPYGLEYVAGSLRWVYFVGDGAQQPPPRDTIALPDPLVAAGAGAWQLRFVRPPMLPVTDYWNEYAYASLIFEVRTVCPVTEDAYSGLTGTYSAYLYAGENFKKPLSYSRWDYIGSINKLRASTPLPLSLEKAPTWTAKICNENDDGQITMPLLNVYGSASIQLTTATDITNWPTATQLPITTVDSLHSTVELPTMNPGACRTLVLEGAYLECTTGVLTLQPGVQCTGAAPCLSTSTVQLTAVPREGSAQLTVVADVQGDIPLCEPVEYLMTVLNVKTGKLYRQDVTLRLPPFGQELVPGSCRIEYKGQSLAIPDPVAGPNGLTWPIVFDAPPFNTDGLPGADKPADNTYFIHFKLTTTCDYIDGLRFTYRTAWENQCGDLRYSPAFYGPQVPILGAPSETNFYDLKQASEFPASACSPLELRIAIANPGNLGPTTGTEKIRMVLPEALEYIAGSYQPAHNAPALAPMPLPFDTVSLLDWDMPIGVQAGDSIVFTLKIQIEEPFEGCIRYLPMEVQTLARNTIACNTAPDGNCGIDFVMVRKTFLLAFEKPNLGIENPVLQATSAPPDSELWTLTFDLHNLAPNIPANGSLHTEVRMDVNGNSTLDPDDQLLEAFFVPSNSLPAGQTATQTLEVTVPATQTCYGIWFLLNDSACVCVGDTVFVAPSPLQNAGSNHTICLGSTVQIGQAPIVGYQYQWSSASALLDNPSASSPTYLGDSLSLFSILVLHTERTGGCTSDDTVTVANRYVEASAQPQPVRCFGESNGGVSVSVAVAEMPLLFTWNHAGATDSVLAAIPAGVYTATITDALGCRDTVFAEVTQPTLLELSVSSSDFNGYGVPCFGATSGSASATAIGGTPGYAYSWSNSHTGDAATGLPTGSYTITATDQNGCTAQVAFALAQPPALVLDLSIKNNLCPDGQNGRIVLQIQGGVPDYVVNGQASDPLFEWEQLAAGNYTVVITDANGCTADTTVEILHLFSTVTLATDSVSCHGQADGQSVVTGSGYPTFSVQWSTGATGPVFVGHAGSYTVTVTDGLGCTYIRSATIGEPPLLSGWLVADSVRCRGESNGSIAAFLEGGTPPVQGYLNGSPVPDTVQNLSAGAYTLMFLDANNCPLQLDAIVAEPALLQHSQVVTDVLCHGDTSGIIAVLPSGGTAPFGLIWSDTGFGMERTGLPSGNYAFTITDAKGCTDDGTALVQEPEAYDPQLSVNKACFGTRNAHLVVSNAGPGTFLYGVDEPSYTYETRFEGLGGGNHQLFLADSVGCIFAFPFFVETYPHLLGTAERDTTITLGDSVMIFAQPAFGVAPESLMVQWSSPIPDIMACDTCSSTVVWPQGNTVFMAFFATKEGCLSQDPVQINVRRGDIYFPNVIRPNEPGDPRNCCFTGYPGKRSVQQIRRLEVFDRWGNNVFQKYSFDAGTPALGWDGTYRGQMLNPAVFVWQAEVEYIDGAVEFFSGDVTVVR